MTIGVMQMLAERYRAARVDHHHARARHHADVRDHHLGEMYRPWRDLFGFRARLLVGVAGAAMAAGLFAWWSGL